MSTLPPGELQYQLDHINDTKAPGVVAATSIFGFIALVTLILRVYQRARKHDTNLGLDDWLMLAASIFAFGNVLALYMTCHYGIGKHVVAITSRTAFRRILQWQTLIGFSYPIAMTLAKLSILAFIARIFTLRQRYLKWGVWTTAVYTILWCIASYLQLALTCKPTSRLWNIDNPCNPGRAATIWNGAFSTLGDAVIVILPQPLIWKLQMSTQRRVVITMLLAAGFFATACGVVRMILSYQLNSYDVTYASAVVTLFYTLEILVAITCGNLPVMHRTATSGLSSFHRLWETMVSQPRSIFSSASSRDLPSHHSSITEVIAPSPGLTKKAWPRKYISDDDFMLRERSTEGGLTNTPTVETLMSHEPLRREPQETAGNGDEISDTKILRTTTYDVRVAPDRR